MKSILTTKSSFALMLLFIWIDTLGILKGFGPRASGIEAALVFISLNSYFSESFTFGAGSVLFMGIIMDAISPVPVYTVTFALLFYISLILKQKFYNPGSPAHIFSFLPSIMFSRLILYAAGNGVSGHLSSMPVLSIIAGSVLDFSLFTILLLLFRKRDVAVMYKMR